jgi:hypothetical protein
VVGVVFKVSLIPTHKEPWRYCISSFYSSCLEYFLSWLLLFSLLLLYQYFIIYSVIPFRFPVVLYYLWIVITRLLYTNCGRVPFLVLDLTLALFKWRAGLCFYSSRFFLGVAVGVMCLLVTLLLSGPESFLFSFSMCFSFVGLSCCVFCSVFLFYVCNLPYRRCACTLIIKNWIELWIQLAVRRKVFCGLVRIVALFWNSTTGECGIFYCLGGMVTNGVHVKLNPELSWQK